MCVCVSLHTYVPESMKLSVYVSHVFTHIKLCLYTNVDTIVHLWGGAHDAKTIHIYM